MATDRRRKAFDLLRRTPIGRPARWIWHQRPIARREAAYGAWLAQRSLEDDERMTLVCATALREDSGVVDVGAAAGEFLQAALRFAPRGTHVAYEPIPELAARLRADFPTVAVREVAVGDSSGTTRYAVYRNGVAWSGLQDYPVPMLDKALQWIDVDLATLDDDLPADYHPALIKIDVNGGELDVLRGAREVLRRDRPTLLLEHGYPAASYGATSSELYDFLIDLGYAFFLLDGSGPLSWNDFEQRMTAEWNFLVRHRSAQLTADGGSP